jgi:NADP-dependent 3-hydroxy acid dehydrogenase YdfG
MDVTDQQQVEEVVQEVLRTYGRIDFLINNAGTDHTLSITELSLEQWNRVLGVNLTGAFVFTRAGFANFRDKGSGHKINI